MMHGDHDLLFSTARILVIQAAVELSGSTFNRALHRIRTFHCCEDMKIRWAHWGVAIAGNFCVVPQGDGLSFHPIRFVVAEILFIEASLLMSYPCVLGRTFRSFHVSRLSIYGKAVERVRTQVLQLSFLPSFFWRRRKRAAENVPIRRARARAQLRCSSLGARVNP